MNIDYEHLKTFCMVARYKSFTQAAVELSTSQPAVTRLINSLEGQLGCKLFFRDRHTVSLTPEGQQLYSYASLGCEQFEKGVSTVTELSSMENGHLMICSNEIGLRGFVDQVLDIYHRKYPKITINLKNTPSSTALRELNQGVTDGDTVTYYAMLFKSYTITYFEEHNISLGQDDVVFRADADANQPYTVNMGYTTSDIEHHFEGWNVLNGGSYIDGYTVGTIYLNHVGSHHRPESIGHCTTDDIANLLRQCLAE